MRNNLNLVVLLGIAFSGVGVFCFGIAADEIYRQVNYGGQLRMDWELGIPLSMALTFITLGIGMMLRQKWVRIPTTLALIILGGLWGIFIAGEISNGISRNGGDSMIIYVSFSLGIYAIILFLILFINNEYTLTQLGVAKEEEPVNENILDR